MFNAQKALEVFNSVTTRKELEALFNAADNTGFYLGSSWDAHKRHLERIINKNNPLNLQIPRFLSDPKQEFSENYTVFEAEVKKYFAQFGVNEAIKERMQHVNVDTKFSSYPHKKTREEVIALGYTPHPDYVPNSSWYAYDLSKPTKLRFIAKHFEFNRLLALIGGPELPYYSDHSFPEVPETDQYIIHPNRKVQFKDEELATCLRDLLVEKYRGYQNHMIKL